MDKQFTLPYEGGLIEKNLPAGILHNYEKIWTDIYPEARPASLAVADMIVAGIKACEGRLFRLGLTTGATPALLYEELLRRYRDNLETFRRKWEESCSSYQALFFTFDAAQLIGRWDMAPFCGKGLLQ